MSLFKRLKSLFFNMLLTMASLVLVLAVAEFLSAYLLARPPQPDARASFREGFLIMNSHNYRDFEYPDKKGEGVFRIVVAGDSFTFGDGVNFDDIYAKKLERYLNYLGNVNRITYQVMNMGIPGRSTPKEVKHIMKAIPEYDPDLVILGYCINDAEDKFALKEVLDVRKKFFYKDFDKGEGWKATLFDHSALYRLVAKRIFSTNTYRGQIRYYRWLYRDEYTGWQRTQAALSRLGELSRKEELPTVVLIFPLLSFGLDKDYPFRDIHKKLHATLKEAGLPYVDLIRRYRGLDRHLLEAVPYANPHPSDVGHRLAAETLMKYLVNNKLVPTPKKFQRPKSNVNVPTPFPGPLSKNTEDSQGS